SRHAKASGTLQRPFLPRPRRINNPARPTRHRAIPRMQTVANSAVSASPNIDGISSGEKGTAKVGGPGLVGGGRGSVHGRKPSNHDVGGPRRGRSGTDDLTD